MAGRKYVLRVPNENPHALQYVSFHVFTGGKTRVFSAGWVLGMFPKYAAQFDRRDVAQLCIDLWKKSDHPLPDTTVIEEYDDGV